MHVGLMLIFWTQALDQTVFVLLIEYVWILGGIHNFRDRYWCCHLHSSCGRAIKRQIIVLAYLVTQFTKFHAVDWKCWFLHSFIWSRVMRFFAKDPTGVHGRKHESPNSPRPKKERRMKSKVKRMLFIFFDIKGTIHKEFVVAVQTFNSAYYCDVLRRLLENMRRLRPELWWQ
jgi:hypothetical protein